MKWITSRNVKMNIGISILVAVLLEVLSAAQYYYAHNLLQGELEERVVAELGFKDFLLRETLQSAEQTMLEHMWEMNRDLSHPDSMFNILRSMVAANDKIVGSCLAFVPNYYPEKGRLFEPYAYEENGQVKVNELAGNDTHDYTSHPAFLKIMKTGKPFWCDPYDDYAMNGKLQSLTTYSYPLKDAQGRIAATCGIDVSLSWLGDTLNAQHLHSSSFFLFLTRNGQLIAGPPVQRVSKKRLDTVLSLINDSTVSHRLTSNGKVKVIEYYDEERKDEGSIYYSDMHGNLGWQVALVCYENEVYGKLRTMRFYITLLMLGGFILMLFIIHRMVKNTAILHRVELRQERIDGELRIAKNIQMQMLPKQFPPYPERNDLDIYGTLVPAREVGGDLFDFFLRDEKLFFCIGDVSGKGVPSAMVMAQTLSLFRMAAAHERNLARIMQRLNEVLCEGNESSMFITLFIGILDLPTGRLRYCNAGHDNPFLVGNSIERIEAKANLPIGVFDNTHYEAQEMMLAADTMIFLYTDGITEAKNIARKLFGIKRLTKVLAGGPRKCQPAVERVIEAVRRFALTAEQSDDVTILAIRYLGEDEHDLLCETITLKNDVKQVKELSDFVKDVVGRLGVESSMARKLRLAVEEAVVNVMEYAYPAGMEGKVTVSIRWNGKRLKFVITDTGVVFDPTETAQTDTSLSAEDRPIGGLGILLVRELMDFINYERIDGQNILTLIKEINTEE